MLPAWIAGSGVWPARLHLQPRGVGRRLRRPLGALRRSGAKGSLLTLQRRGTAFFAGRSAACLLARLLPHAYSSRAAARPPAHCRPQGAKLFWVAFWMVQHAWMTLFPALIALAMFGELGSAVRNHWVACGGAYRQPTPCTPCVPAHLRRPGAGAQPAHHDWLHRAAGDVHHAHRGPPLWSQRGQHGHCGRHRCAGAALLDWPAAGGAGRHCIRGRCRQQRHLRCTTAVLMPWLSISTLSAAACLPTTRTWHGSHRVDGERGHHVSHGAPIHGQPHHRHALVPAVAAGLADHHHLPLPHAHVSQAGLRQLLAHGRGTRLLPACLASSPAQRRLPCKSAHRSAAHLDPPPAAPPTAGSSRRAPARPWAAWRCRLCGCLCTQPSGRPTPWPSDSCCATWVRRAALRCAVLRLLCCVASVVCSQMLWRQQ